MNISQILKNLGVVISKNSPHILTGLGCAGVISTAVLATKASPRANALIADEEEYRFKKRLAPLSKTDKFKLTWKCYVPTTVVGAGTIACIIGVNTVHLRRSAALASLLTISETAMREFQSKVTQEIGKPRVERIHDEITKEQLHKNPPSNNIIFTGTGDVLCWDKLGDRYFYSSHETIRQKINDLNYRLRNEMTLPLNDFYYEVGLEGTELGAMVQFDIERGQIEPRFSTHLTADNKPCLVIELKVYPINE